MRIDHLDHLVITTQDLDKCLHFYVDILGMELDDSNNRYAVKFGNQKFNIHRKKAEFLPAARNVTCGSQDICLIAQGNIQEIKARQGKVIALVSGGDNTVSKIADEVLEIPDTLDCLEPLIATIPLQLLAYHIAVCKGKNVDQPRNLAKSVTVE